MPRRSAGTEQQRCGPNGECLIVEKFLRLSSSWLRERDFLPHVTTGVTGPRRMTHPFFQDRIAAPVHDLVPVNRVPSVEFPSRP
jgi:hypothetical protein